MYSKSHLLSKRNFAVTFDATSYAQKGNVTQTRVIIITTHQIDISYCSRIKGKADHPENVFDKKGGVILFQ